ncbi:MAG: hypothetical protein P9M15_01760 [Candidatus Electryoneaceae bacterium]|nr:hypothetical protein [Candidatus Electryoneaceae bacterium]
MKDIFSISHRIADNGQHLIDSVPMTLCYAIQVKVSHDGNYAVIIQRSDPEHPGRISLRYIPVDDDPDIDVILASVRRELESKLVCRCEERSDEAISKNGDHPINFLPLIEMETANVSQK